MTAAVHYDGSQVTELVSKPWVALYSDQVPADVTPVFADMLSVFRDAVRRNAGGPAIFYFDAVMDYATLDAESDALAVWLQARGVARGDRVAIVAQNIPAFPLLCLAAWKLGAVPVPGNPMYRAPELARIFADASPAAILCQDADAEEVCAALDLVGMSGLPLVFVSPRDWVGEAFCDRLPARNGVAEGERLADIIERGVGAAPGAIDIAPGELGLILYTSGTTGLPKGAMLTHGNMVFNAEVMHAWFSLGADDRILSIAPFFHVTGVECHICLAFRCAIAMVLHYRFEPLTVLEMIRAYRPTFTIGAITAMNAMMGAPGACAADMASLTKVFSGGAPIPPALRRVIGERLGISIHPTYGMTELTAPAVMTPFGHEAPERNGVLSIGLPAPSTDIRIADDAGTELPIETAGEVLVRGPQVMAGYWRKPEETAAALAGGWMHTGDIGFRDEAGWIYLVDRKKDVIIASGFKVWPREVEDVLYAHPAVREAAVIGVPDAYRGENVKGVVSLVNGAEITPQDLVAHCRMRLAAYKVPGVMVILDDLPKTVSGKIQRAALRATTVE